MSDSEQQLAFHCIAMSEQDGIAICEWKYSSPYHIYNWPAWAELQADRREFADPDIRQQQYFSVKNSRDELVAFFQLFPLQDTIRLGIFVHPSLLNCGIGKQTCKLALKKASEQFSQPFKDLEVSTWNTRAIHVYEQLGFKIVDQYELFNSITNKTEMVYNMVYMK